MTARVGVLVLVAALWLVLSSSVLLWIFPLNIVASGYVAYFIVKHVAATFRRTQLQIAAALVLVLGLLLSGYILVAGDPAMKYIAGPYSLLNLAVFLVTASLVYRRLQK